MRQSRAAERWVKELIRTMRHRAMFIYKKSLEDFCDWFRNELTSIDLHPDVTIRKNKYDIEITANSGEKEFSYSIFKNPSIDDELCLYVKPKLKFIPALLGKKDYIRELATKHAHSILSNSNKIIELGWYLETQVWRGPTDAP
jgi:hypothetical protein